ncbi:hypothetical protein C8J57DRAFT_1727466 [Mycena rebaudengoi]|nr:hypothetical protein C8J57DRAFT_1727466 [Mycena rebaudengoi]
MSPTRNSGRSPPRGGRPYPSSPRSGPLDFFGNSQNDYSQNRPQPFGSSSRHNTQDGYGFPSSYGGPGTPSADPRYNARMPALSSTVTIDQLCNTYKIGTSGRNSAHEYCQLSSEDQAAALYVKTLANEEQQTQILTELGTIKESLVGISAFCVSNWQPGEEQKEILKSLLRHYVIQPLASYNSIAELVKDYIKDRAGTIDLEIYNTNAAAKRAVNDFLAAQVNYVRSTFRKTLFASFGGKNRGKKLALQAFAKKMVGKYYLPPAPDAAPRSILASLALMRQIAGPLSGTASVPGGDTGFWTGREKELDRLYKENGDERSGPKWKAWEDKIIEDDDKKNNTRSGAEGNARTRQQIDEALRNSSANLRARGNSSDNDSDGQEDHDGTTSTPPSSSASVEETSPPGGSVEGTSPPGGGVERTSPPGGSAEGSSPPGSAQGTSPPVVSAQGTSPPAGSVSGLVQ